MRGNKSNPAKLKIKYFRSAIGAKQKHRLVLKGLGLKKLNQVVERSDTPSIRHMVKKISYLVKIVED